MGRGNESLFAASGSRDQDGRHAHICQKPFKIFSSRAGRPISKKIGTDVASMTPAHHSLFK